MKISLQNVTKDFGAGPVLDNLSLDIEDHELFFLLGPSGCGKTTILRMLAGFYPPDQGDVYFDDNQVNHWGAHERNVGMVFQNYALWPHLTVAQNVGYGLDVRKTDRYERDRRVGDALTLVQMERYSNRFPNELSGGQQQRVALARALVIKPDVLLFDEPLSNLDTRLRLELREEIRNIHSRTRITTVYVTHDHAEALSLADRIAVLNEGRILQVGDPRTIYRQPNSRFVADFVGETNWWEGTVLETSADGTLAQTEVGRFTGLPNPKLKTGDPIWVGFRPEAVRMDSMSENHFLGVLNSVNYLGEREEYHFKVGPESDLKAFVQDPETPILPGTKKSLSVPRSSVLILERR